MDQIDGDVPEESQDNTPQRKPYAPPTLTDFGSVAEITRGTFLDYHIHS